VHDIQYLLVPLLTFQISAMATTPNTMSVPALTLQAQQAARCCKCKQS
jgi:hypothetical protein